MLPNKPQEPTSRDQRNRESNSPRTRLAAQRQRRWAGALSFMTVEDSDQVDFVAMSRTGEDVLLVIADHLDWSAAEDHARLLQSKIYRYLDFVESGELWQRFPDARGRRVTIQVRAKYPATGYASRFLADISAAVSDSGCRLDYSHHRP